MACRRCSKARVTCVLRSASPSNYPKGINKGAGESQPPFYWSVNRLTNSHHLRFDRADHAALFQLHQLLRLLRNVLRRDLELLDQLPRRARVAEAVLNADRA